MALRPAAALSIALVLAGCTADSKATGAEADGHGPDSASRDSGLPTACVPGLPARRTADPTQAAAGRTLLRTGALAAPLIPRVALDNLYWVWGTGRPASDAAFQAAFQDRYGLLPDPSGGPYALGVPALSSSMASLDCLYCHADGVAGAVVVGAGSSRADLQTLFDDLVALAALAETLGMPPLDLPLTLEDRTPAAGSNDAFGLGMALSEEFGPDLDIATRYGGQQPAPWWQARYKDRVYTDGQGSAEGHRTMAAMLLAFGNSPTAIAAREEELVQVWHAIQDTTAPPWPFDAPSAADAAAGAALYATHCADCHGTVCDSPAYPDRIVSVAEIGTDPLRATSFGETEAAWINASWFGAAHPVEATAGYLAPPLVGVWASAPYLHNGSVPDLAGLLSPEERPAAWARTGWSADDYDPVRMGWRTTTATPGTAPDSPARRRIVDTTRAGLDSGGHLHGTALSDNEKSALIGFLKLL